MKKLLSLMLCIVLAGNLLIADAGAADGLPFSDVQETDWYYQAVVSMFTQEIINGTDDTIFSPDDVTTRGMAVTVLYRLEGQPEAGDSEFTDVKEDDYFAAAVAWASENNIVHGIDDTHFSPDENVTREQLATFIYRYVQYKGSPASQRSNLNIFQDQSTISDYAEPAIRWAVSVGILSGRSSTTIAPNGNTTRAELAQMLYNLQNLVLSSDTVMQAESMVLPVLMFHSVQDDIQTAYTLTTAEFDSIMSMLYESGYHSITLQQLVDYVDSDSSLPENPILITLDDGYQDNLDNACPILEKYGFTAVISVIGCYVGLDSYNGSSIFPHFSFESAAQYTTGTISIQSHTNKMHMPYDYPNLEDGRSSVLKRASETSAEYYQRLVTDFTDSYNLIADASEAPLALTYPGGMFSVESEAAAKQVGYRVTLATRNGVNVITKGNSSSLYLLNRINMDRTYTAEEFNSMVTSLYYD